VRGLEGAGVPVSGKRGCLRRAPRPRSRTLRPTKGASSSTFAATSTVASLDRCQPRPLPGLLPPPAARRHTAPIRMAPAPPSSHPGYAPMPLARTGRGCGGYWGTCGAYARRSCCGLLHVGSMMRSRHARGLAALSRDAQDSVVGVPQRLTLVHIIAGRRRSSVLSSARSSSVGGRSSSCRWGGRRGGQVGVVEAAIPAHDDAGIILHAMAVV
jgi:hypothetical protein